MKVAIISFGHTDSIIPLTKTLNQKVDVTLFLTLALNKTTSSVVSITEPIIKTGLHSEKSTESLLSREIVNYFGKEFPVRLFFYKNLKFKSLTNWILSFKFSRILRKFDIIHINGQNAAAYQLKYLLPFKKFVYTIHDLKNHSGEETKNILALKYNISILNSKSQAVLQNTTDYKTAVQDFHGNSSTINFIPFGILDIYCQFDTSKLSVTESDVLFFGRISPYKGIEYFVEAIEKLKNDMPELKAVIAGSGKFYFDISNIEKDSRYIILNKFIDSDELSAIIKKTKIVVCPYVDATQSGVAMTAFAFQKPVIATDTGGFRDMIIDGQNGYLVPAKDSESIYKRLKQMLTEQNLLNEMQQNIVKFSTEGEFSWGKIAERYKEVYEKALN